MSEALVEAPVGIDAGRGAGAIWKTGVAAGLAWLVAAGTTQLGPDLHEWENTRELALGEALLGVVLLLLALLPNRLAADGSRLRYWGPWLVALGLVFALWELAAAKLGWLPRPFFAPPQGILDVYVGDGEKLLECVLHSLRLWGTGYGIGALVGIATGVAIGWSTRAAYWCMPVLKLIGPVPANAWLPIVFFALPTSFSGSVFLIALSSGIPAIILTWSGVASVDKAYYDVARVHGASERFLIRHVAIPAALPHVFVGLFMGLYNSFAILVVAEMLGVKAGLGWYLQWSTSWAAYGNVHAALLIMALICSGLVTLLFTARDRLLSWQKGLVRW